MTESDNSRHIPWVGEQDAADHSCVNENLGLVLDIIIFER